MSDPRVPGPVRVRASDPEREEVAARLQTAMGEGRLTLDEGEQRLTGVYSAVYRDELPAFTADLPPAGPAPGAAPGPRPGRRPGVRSGRPGSLAGLAGRCAVLCAVIVGVLAVSAGASLWPVILLGILAVMLVKHGRRRRWSGASAWSGSGHHPCRPAGRRPDGEPGRWA